MQMDTNLFLRRQSRTVLLLAALALPASSYASDEKLYWFNFPAESTSWRPMFPAPGAKVVFENMMTAVDIQEVKCDGVAVVPTIFAPTDLPHLQTLILEKGDIVYQCTLGFFECWTSLEGDVAYQRLRQFRIPEDARLIEVKYQIRYPDGSRSKTICVKYVASDQKVHILKLPAIEMGQAAGNTRPGANLSPARPEPPK